ncbi:MAG: hypothetical protein SFU86_05175 [Pirellulaceae bacterium]|nr:hypothetical protein [Pirellulaceae bacterium]
MPITDTIIPGGWTEREIDLGSRMVRLRVPADPDAVLARLIEGEVAAAAEPHLADPYWAKLWPAALHLAAIIARRQREFSPGTKTLELGCGSGLVGLAGLTAGLDVTFSDYVPFAVELALENARRNGFPTARGLVLDWRYPLAEQFDFLLAGDVTYDRTHIGPLLGVLDQMLSPGGQAWIADGGRGPAADFLAQAAARGYRVRLFDESDQSTATPKLGHCQRMVLRKVTP